MLGAVGLAGCGSDDTSTTTETTQPPGDTATGAAGTHTDASTAASTSATDDRDIDPYSLLDDGAQIRESVRTLNFRRNMRTEVEGDRVSIDAQRGLDVVGSEGGQTSISSIDVGSGLDATAEDGTLTITRADGQGGSAAQLENRMDDLSNRMEDRGFLAGPGNVQSTLDDALEDGVGRVDLVSGTTYEFDSSIEVPPGVSLDCTGAYVDVQSDVNAFDLHTQSQIVNPQVRTTQVDGYSSSIFHISPQQYGDGFGSGRPVPVWTVSGGWSEMTPGEGTCIELHGVRENPNRQYDVSRDNRQVYFCFVAHNCIGGRRFAYLHREGGDTTRGGHVNGNIVKGFAKNATRFVETDDSSSGKNMVNGNKFYLTTQPYEESEWLWYANKGSRNELYEWGKNWDYARYSDNDGDGYAESWYIGPNAGKNFTWRKLGSASGGLGSTVVDDSDGASGSRYLILEEMGVPVEDVEVWDDAQ